MALAGAAVILTVPAFLFGTVAARAATGGAPAITVTPSPCNPRPAGGGCALAPQSLAVSFPFSASGTTAALNGVDVIWATTGRPPAAPRPAMPVTFLSLASGRCTTPAGATPPTVCTWPWPAGLEAAGSGMVLNGTYTVAACSPPSGTPARSPDCLPVASPAPADVVVSAPPGAPEGVRLSAASSSSTSPVAVTWTIGPEPDLAAYTVSRNNQLVFACTLHGAAIAGAGPCGPSPSYTDRPNAAGHITYQVVARRFGATGGTANDVASPPTTASLTLGPPGTIGSLPPIQVLGVPASPTVVVPNTSSGPATTGPTTPSPDPGGPGQLPFGSHAHVAVAAPGAAGAGRGSSGVGRPALIAAGLLVLAVAAHLLYLKGAVARYQRKSGLVGE